MTSPSNPVLVTASEVPEESVAKMLRLAPKDAQENVRTVVAYILSDPAIQTLIVRKVVEAARDPLDGTIYALVEGVPLAILPDELLAVLLSTRGPDHG